MKKNDAIYKLYLQVCHIDADGVAVDTAGNHVAYDEAAVQAYIDANAYKAQRAAAYPSIPDQLDLLYHGGMEAWKAAITAVKTQFPK
jgi:LmbE family N-acetylglucosaminyl deacetylase